MTIREDSLGVIVEGACDRFFGRPVEANPYHPLYAMDAYAAWSVAWTEADWLIDIRGQEEASRWLREAA
jgi:hypothetical protein